MPFKMTISSVENRQGEIAISGRIVEGAYFGPEAITVPGKDNPDLHAWVTHHALRGSMAWPVEPAHDVVLTLSIRRPQQEFTIDAGRPLVGNGCILTNQRREEITDALADPRFWAMQLGDRLQAREGEDFEPSERYFGVTVSDINAYYESLIHRRFHQGVWPFVRVPMADSRFLEIEFAASVEFQDRFWIGVCADRALTGYHSGHFSLPAFRFEEIRWFLDQATAVPGVAALMLTACYLSEVPAQAQAVAADFLRRIPGVKPDLAPEMAERILDDVKVEKLRWSRDADNGWVNNWAYSQRNPDGKMSVLGDPEFALIDRFFGGV